MTGTVYILSSSTGRSATVFHTSDCRAAPDPSTRREIPRADAEGRGLTECKICGGEVDHSTGDDPWRYHRLVAEAGDG